jgi:hypothetical protein
VCNADIVKRRRALPSGTVGGRIAETQKPCASSACAYASVLRFVADDQRLDGRGRRHQVEAALARAFAEARDRRVELFAAPVFAACELHRRERRGGLRRRQRGGVDVRARGFGEVLDEVGITTTPRRNCRAPCPA